MLKSELQIDEERLLELAEERAEEYRRSVYVHQITLAEVAHRDGDMRHLQKLLESCPADLRGWEWDRLKHTSDQALMTLLGDKEWVYDLTFSADGKRFVSAGKDGTMKVWNAADGTEVMTLRGLT